MKKKIIIITICCLCLGLIRSFTPYLGKPFLIYCDNDKARGFYLSNKVKKIELLSPNEPCIKFIRYCSELEEIGYIGSFKEPLNISDISNLNLKRLFIAGKCVNWSSLNECTELEELHLSYSDFTSIEDISNLKKLEILYICNETELSLNKLNELQNLKELSIIGLQEIDCEKFSNLDRVEALYLGDNESMSSRSARLKNPNQLNELKNLKELRIRCQNNIDCEDFSKLEKLESLYLNTDGNISGLDKMDNVTSLTLVHPNQEIGNDICDMDAIKEVHVFNSKLSDEVEKKLEKKHVVIKYHNS